MPVRLISHEEINFQRLLSKCQERAAEGKGEYDWRLDKYLENLEVRLVELHRHAQAPPPETLTEYRTALDFLSKILASSKSTWRGAAGRSGASGADDETDARADGAAPTGQKCPPHDPVWLFPHGPSSTRDTITKQIHQKTTERGNLKAREALLGNNDAGLRRRFGAPAAAAAAGESNDDDIKDLLNAHRQAQEQIADEMLSLTRGLKEHALAANEIIRKDTTKLSDAGDLAERNAARLETETDRLGEHTQTACRCWIWFLLAVVTMTFIAMVWVMKLFGKKH